MRNTRTAWLLAALVFLMSISAVVVASPTRRFNGVTIIDNLEVSAIDANKSSTTTNAVVDVLVLEDSVTGTGVATTGLGGGLVWQLETATNLTIDEAGSIDVVWTDATANSTDSKMNFSVRVADTTTNTMTLATPGVLQIHDGSVPTFGVATSAGELGVEGDIETDANLDVAGTCAVGSTLAVTGAQTNSSTLDVNNSGATTNAVVDILVLEQSVSSTGVGANGLGGGLVWQLETATNSTIDEAGRINVVWADATANSTDSNMNFSVRVADSTVNAMTLATPGVLQIHDGSVPTFSVATAAGELGVEGDIEADGNVDIAGTLNVAGATTTIGDATGDALTINAGTVTINTTPGIVITDANTNASLNGLSITRSVTSTGVGAAGLGTSATFYLETDTNTTTDQAGQIGVVWVDPAVASTDSTMNFTIRVADGNVTPVSIATPGVLQVHDGSVPSFAQATAAGEIGIEGDAEIDGNLYADGACTVTGAATMNGAVTLGDAYADAVSIKGQATYGPAGNTADYVSTFNGDSATSTLTHAHATGILTYSDDFAAANLTATTNVGAATLSLTAPSTVEYLLASHAATAVSPTGEHTLYTVATGKTAVITKVVIRSCSASLNQDTDAIVQFGCNAGTSNDVIGAKTLTAPTSTGTFSIIQPTAISTGATESTMCTTGQNFAINVTTAATDTTTCVIDVWGYLF